MTRWLGSAVLAALLAAAPAGAQEVTLRLHQFLPLQAAIPSGAIEPWIERVEAAADGRIEIQHFPAMQLGGAPPSLYDQARDGVVDLVWTVLGYTPGRFPRSEAFELPFMVTTGEATSRAFHLYAERHAADEFPGVRPIALHTHGPGLLHVRGPGVTRLEDMAGLDLRGPTRVVTKLLERLGANAIGMPVPAVPEALSKGVLDGVAVPWEVTLPLKIAELVDSHTEFAGDRGLYTATFLFGMSQASYDRLPADLQAVIDAHAGPDTAARFGRAMDETDRIGRRVARERGNVVHVLDAAETARWRAAAQDVVADWIAEMDAKGFDGAALAADARQLVARQRGE